jgi:hypothetical protein
MREVYSSLLVIPKKKCEAPLVQVVLDARLLRRWREVA